MSIPLTVNSTPGPKAVTLERGTRGTEPSPVIRLATLRAPLAVKLFGANLLVVALLVLALVRWTAVPLGPVFGVALVVVALHLVLVLLALRPIRDLEDAASRVWHGDFGARVARSAFADRDVVRVGAMFNTLLDGLVSDRAKMRALATEVIAVGDRERAALARELHDSTAQRLAALLLQLSAAARDARDPALAARLESARDAAAELTEEVRLLSHTVHPRVLDDLGLVAALEKLARDTAAGTGITIDVDAPRGVALPHGAASVLYRVAQEAVRNAVRHAAPRRITMAIRVDDRAARLEVRDDGAGFDLAAAERRRAGMGLLSMRERVALVDGQLDISTAPGIGTTLVATVPVVSSEDADFRRME
jgi:signal transduction histidine kinase